LVQLAKDLLTADCPGIRLLDHEKTSVLDHLNSVRTDPAGLFGLVSTETSLNNVELSASLLALKNRLNAQPGEIDAVIDDAEANISSLYNSALQNMRLPILQRTPFTADGSVGVGNPISRSLTTELQKIIDRYGSDQARIRLLAVHALIKRYQWDHDALPGSLSDLNADDLVTDPFTGDHLIYKRVQDRYTLTSAGPLDTSGTQQRSPVQLR
jgi:hypothetical protein